jgi:hypothetical protein
MKFNRFIENSYPNDAEKLKQLYNDLIISYTLLINNYERQINNNRDTIVYVDEVKEGMNYYKYIGSYCKMHFAEYEIPIYLRGIVGLIEDFENN